MTASCSVMRGSWRIERTCLVCSCAAVTMDALLVLDYKVEEHQNSAFADLVKQTHQARTMP